MNLTTLTSSDFAQIAKLLKKKEALLERVAKVDRTLAAFETAKSAAVAKPAKAVSKGRSGQVKETILAAIKAAGSKGATVPDLAKKLGMKVVNIRAFIFQTGKKLGVKKLTRGIYALKG